MVRFSELIHEKAFMVTPVGCYFFIFGVDFSGMLWYNACR